MWTYCRHRGELVMTMVCWWWWMITMCGGFSRGVSGRLVNVTIDDTTGDPTNGFIPIYGGTSGWNAVSDARPCNSCALQPDLKQFWMQTYHDGAALSNRDDDKTVTIRFTGVAFYAGFALFQNTRWLTNVHFTLDGRDMGTFLWNISEPSFKDGSQAVFEYNVGIKDVTGLSNTPHTLVIGTVGGPDASIMLFDFLLYTQDIPDGGPGPPPPPPPSSGPSTLLPTTQTSSSSSSTSSSSSSAPLATGNSGSGTSGSSSSNNDSSSSTSSSGKSHTGAIVGGIVGGLAALGLFGLFLIWCIRRRQDKDVFDQKSNNRLSYIEKTTPTPWFDSSGHQQPLAPGPSSSNMAVIGHSSRDVFATPPIGAPTPNVSGVEYFSPYAGYNYHTGVVGNGVNGGMHHPPSTNSQSQLPIATGSGSATSLVNTNNESMASRSQNIPNPVAAEMAAMRAQIGRLEAQLQQQQPRRLPAPPLPPKHFT